MTPYYLHRSWLWLTERVAVEVVRFRTGWLADAWHWLTDVVRGRGRGAGLHVLPAGETPEPVADVVYGDPVMPLPLAREDYLSEHIAAAWAVTGTTHADYWRATAPAYEADTLSAMYARYLDLPGPALGPLAEPGTGPERRTGRAGEPTNVSCGYWRPRDVIPARVIAALERSRPDQTVIDDRLTGPEHDTWLERLIGGDPWGGLGSQEAYLERLFARPLARAS